jgi:hypothetical protein
MDTVRLIDGVVRHTTAFIAQLSTAAGLRAPLAHIADQVFLDLAREIESQGVSRKVVASMFGMALRGYQRKVQRLTESSSHKGKTLWEALVEHLHTHGPSLRFDLERRFAADGEDHVAAVLRDLTESGAVYSTGRGDSAIYGLSSEQDRERMLLKTQGENLKVATWYAIYRQAQSVAQLQTALGVSEEELHSVVGTLIDEGLIQSSEGARLTPTAWLESRRFLVPVGAEHGWEVAVFDHYRAVLDAIAAKLRLRTQDPETARYVGGATLVFDLHSEHPFRDEVWGLLERVRTDVNAIWERVSAYNKAHPIGSDQLSQVSFYFGQNVEAPTKEAPPTTKDE